jgi:hypothetical protein
MKKLSVLLLMLMVTFILSIFTTDLFAQSSEVVASVSKDNTLYESLDGSLSNGAGSYFFVGKTNTGSIRRGCIAFDVSSIPQGSTVVSVILTLSMSKTVSSSEVIALHRLMSDWGEGSSNADINEGSGTTSTAGDATWVDRFWNSNSTWIIPGGDFISSASASQSVTGVGSYTWGSIQPMIADVQLWVDKPDSNFGWILIGNESSTTTAKRFDTKENASVQNRPVLTITYLPATNVEDNASVNPQQIELFQNLPNPFNPVTTITYIVPAGISEQLSLKIYDIRGTFVTTLVENITSPGTHSVTWDGKDTYGNSLSSGLYIYQLKAGNYSIANKMMLIR